MNLRDTALAAYYYSSLPYRRLRWPPASAPVCILFYHRISDRHENEWTMPTRVFEQQMDYLEANCDLVTLETAQRLMNGVTSTKRPAVCITFDDGYGDNVDFALPLIIDRQIPCTYFVSQHHVASGEPFPHDVARGCPLPPNTIAELRDMSEAGIEIGGHTRSHVDLGQITDEKRVYDEVISAGIDLAAAVGQRVRYFAFPFGLEPNLHPLAFAMAQAAGYEAVCSAYGGYNFPGDDTFHLQRIHADPCMLRLKNWLSVDPRKIRLTHRYDYRSHPQYRAWTENGGGKREYRISAPLAGSHLTGPAAKAAGPKQSQQ